MRLKELKKLKKFYFIGIGGISMSALAKFLALCGYEVSGSDGVQGHTRTLWRLLQRYEVPVFLFVNKCDLPGKSRRELMAELRAKLAELEGM